MEALTEETEAETILLEAWVSSASYFQRRKTYNLKTMPVGSYPHWWETMLASYPRAGV